jgi:hypothetical protein
MAAKIGILGESTATATGEVTVYTVPADKAARVRVVIAIEDSGGTSAYMVRIGNPGSENTMNLFSTASDADIWSGVTAASSVGVLPLGAISDGLGLRGIGIQAGTNNMYLTGGGGYVSVITPFPVDYFLSTGDTVRYQKDTDAMTDHLFQVIGVEDDA